MTDWSRGFTCSLLYSWERSKQTVLRRTVEIPANIYILKVPTTVIYAPHPRLILLYNE